MKKFITHGGLTIALFFLCGSIAVAQDKYEYGSLFTAGGGVGKKYEIKVALNDKFEEINGSVAEGTSSSNMTPVTKLLTELSKNGWEVYNINIFPLPGGNGLTLYYYFIKRKVK